MNQNCSTCKFALKVDEHGGYCRRYPGQVVSVYYPNSQSSEVDTYLPYKGKDDWCGEWKDS